MATEQTTLEQLEEEVAAIRGDQNVLAEAHAMGDSTDLPVTPTSGIVKYSQTGHLNYASGTDANNYDTGRLTLLATATLTLTTSMQTVTGLSAALGVGTYRVHAQLLVNPAGAGGAISYMTHATGGLTVSNGRVSVVELFSGAPVLADYAQLDVQLTGSAPASTNTRITTIDGYFFVSVAGTLNIQVKQAATANSSIVQVGTYLECFPVT